jgi:hypothetical protein
MITTTFGGRAAPPDASLAGFGLGSGLAACAGAVNPATGRERDNKVGRIFMIGRLLATGAASRGPGHTIIEAAIRNGKIEDLKKPG